MRPAVRLCLCCLAGLASTGATARRAPEAGPMRLGAASNFSQGWDINSALAVRDLPIKRLRDSIRWSAVERTAGHYTFDKPTTTWPDRLAQGNIGITLTLNWGNPLYDKGETPHSPAALTAFARFAAAVVRRFPQIDTLEIGNEVNGSNFVSGLVKDKGLARRAQYHLAMVRAAAEAVQTVRPDVKVIGGSTHSLPAGFLWPLLALPDARYIDGLAVHPYTTPIDQLPAQVGLLRQQGRAARLPLYVTEFGSADPRHAGDDLVRGYATLATLGVTEMDWYPLNDRADGLVPLIGRKGALTDAGKAFRFVQSHLAGLAARDANPDPFTLVRRFGPRIEVMWGASRSVAINARKVTAFDATGARLDPGKLSLHEDRAMILIGTAPLTGALVQLGCQPLIADSFYQFGYPHSGKRRAPGDGFERFAQIGGHDLPFEPLPGQQQTGVPWTPYLGLKSRTNLRLMADTLLPAVGAGGGAIVQRYVADKDRNLRLVAEFTPSKQSADGIGVTLSQAGHSLLAQSGRGSIRIDRRLTLRQGQSLSLSVSPRGNARGDTTVYRIRIFDEDICPKGTAITP